MNAMRPEPHVALMVEDDLDVRELAAVLEETALNVVEVESAEAALNCLEERGGEVAMLFADVCLPGELDGAQLAKATCMLWPTNSIVLASGKPGTCLDDLPACVTFMPQPLVTRIRACQSGEPPVILLIEDEPLAHMAERSERLEWVRGQSAGAYRRRSSRKRAAILSQRTSA